MTKLSITHFLSHNTVSKLFLSLYQNISYTQHTITCKLNRNRYNLCAPFIISCDHGDEQTKDLYCLSILIRQINCSKLLCTEFISWPIIRCMGIRAIKLNALLILNNIDNIAHNYILVTARTLSLELFPHCQRLVHSG